MRRILCLCFLLLLLRPALADGAPQWSQLDPEHQKWLLEAFNLPEARFADNVPNEIKQGLLDSIWNVLTPEKKNQVLLYAHLDKPFSASSNSTSQVQAPAWTALTSIQKARAYESLHLDGTQKMIWDAMTPELRQLTFNTLWAYLTPEARRGITR